MSTSRENLPSILTNAIDAIHYRQQTSNENVTSEASNTYKVRNLISFWVLGLCNNYGYVVMLSAALDIIKRYAHVTASQTGFSSSRDCAILSTGLLLLADTIPSLTVKMSAPFLPFYINARMTLVCALSAVGFFVVANADSEWEAILGIMLTSFSCGLGETSLLAYTTRFNKDVIGHWASGTGGAGVFGALTYAGLIQIGFTPKSTMLLMLLVPFCQALAFFVGLKESNNSSLDPSTSRTSLIHHHSDIDHDITIVQPEIDFAQKVNYLPNLMKYVLPLFTVYVCEYFINQGLFELIYFPNFWLTHDAQYRWFQVTYQIGVFISRSSINLFETKQIWLMSILQFANVWYFAYEAIYLATPTIWIVLAFVFWEGLLGGCCYVNTFNRITKELPQQYRSFGMGFVAIGESIGVVTAGLLAIPVHNVICRMPLYETYF